MKSLVNTTPRKKFIWWGATLLASVAAIRFIPGSRNKKPGTVKMLTQDGKLVEVDKEQLQNAGKKITIEELQQWIKK